MFEYLLKKVGIFKTAGIVLSKRGEMRDFIEHIQPKEPAVCNIDFNLPAGLAHAFDPIKILDKGDLDQHDRIHAWTAVIWGILFFHQIINKRPVDRLIDQAEEMILRDHVIHTEYLELLSFFICILCHHNRNTAFP